MPILEKCSMCHRPGGYAEKDTDKICARCKRKVTRVKEKQEPPKIITEPDKE